MSKKMGNVLGHTEGAHPVRVPTPVKTSVPSPKPRGAPLPGSIVHQRTPKAGAVPSYGSSGMEQAMGAHADTLHPVPKGSITHKPTPPAGAVPARMMGVDTSDKIKGGGY